MAYEYDLVILGGGTGGYVAAIRSAQLGLKTAIVENEKIGGTCLHKGCIPSKALLRSAEVFSLTKKSEEFGVFTTGIELNFKKVQERKTGIIEQLYKGVQYLMKQGKIDIYHGFGRILGPSIFSPMPGTISVEMANGSENEMLIPKNIIIATGSRPSSLPGIEIDGNYVMTSDDAIEMEKLPQSITIIGGGVIGIEWASMLADFGVNVTVIEYADQIIPNEDEDIIKELTRLLRKKGINIVTNAKVLSESIEIKEKQVQINAEIKGQIQTFLAEKILVSVGRKPNSDNIGLQNTEIEMNTNGAIKVNSTFQTKESHIYAIGDVIGGLQLAHVASHEGIKAVEHIAGFNPVSMVYENVPKCIYSSPEVASVGFTEKEAMEKGFKVKIGKFPFKAVGKALVVGDAEGFVKIVADEKTNDILGIQMIGPHVTDLISEAGLARVLDATPWEVGNTIHPHPTLSEAIGEAALAVDGLSIHI
ncbi:dihydrolipoyl dehydrogenase [Lederbergia wuyishanensis]|uniref:Dihydrolipoyl dehydrogenase n=1 Tax=Lederbergia wuyishanensis TaxID=1347903 RepID=A0ABU0D176_9BACI|nr:dihydrolipoyl dehydrogenase [Lederbergia wuyishanensis]MCJ8006774.1 dihydrolipoyl dehydrogenase [Lederbergia wuyishanensis]MDQ0342156.1 dihydrolipoamide dehydrogenase [Lederbergia wuyishanensis]